MFYFTRREYDAGSDTFTKKIAPSTSYVHLPRDNVNKGNRLPQAQWLSKLNAEAGGKDVLIFVHGFNTSQAKMLTRLRKLKNGLGNHGFSGPVVGFSWPNREVLDGYWNDQADVPEFARSLLDDGIKPIQGMGSRVHLLCHSMGSYLFVNAVSGLGAGQNIGELAFVAADLDVGRMRPGQPEEQLVDIHTKRLTNYYSPIDRVLDLSATWIHGEPRVGGVGLPRMAKPTQQDVACSNRYQARPNSPRKNRTFSHTWYFDDEVWLKDLAQVLNGTAPNAISTRLTSTVPPDQVLTP